MTTHDPMILRLLDANLNRAVEGLRVLEECARMLLDDRAFTARIKELRHQTASIIRTNKTLDQELLFARNTSDDVLSTGASASELKRDDLVSLLRANAKRAAEAVRALEEYGKLIMPDMAVACKDIRFAVYAIEQEVVAKISRSMLITPERIRLGITINCALNNHSIHTYLDDSKNNNSGLIVLTADGLPDSDFCNHIEHVLETVNRKAVTVLVNGRADLARIADADGVVITHEQISASQARSIVGHGKVVASVIPAENRSPGASSDDSDLDIFHAGTQAFLQIPAKRLKPRIVTGVSNKEELWSLPAESFDGILLTEHESIQEWCAVAKTVLSGRNHIETHQTDGTSPSREK